MTLFLAILIILLAGLLYYFFFAWPKLPPETNAIIDDVLKGELPEVITGETGFAQSAGLDIWYECISPDGPARGTVLLLMALGGDGLIWPPSFVRSFVDAGYRLIRFDYRGTGMSDWVKNWDRRNPYTLTDMAGDAIAVLNVVDIAAAHLVGLSLGGMVAQEIAIHHPERVGSLTLMMTSGYVGDPELPGMSSRFFITNALNGIPLLKYRIMGGEKNLIKERIAKTVSVVGVKGLDVRETAELVLYDLRRRRGINTRAIFQHLTAITLSGSRYEKLRAIDAPTLVIHGTADSFIPVEHGRKLAETLPNAWGLWLDGVGHVFPAPNMDAVVAEILVHLERKPAPTVASDI
jgi:pimeloyl-ACP methyl ester carboxylesterase